MFPQGTANRRDACADAPLYAHAEWALHPGYERTARVAPGAAERTGHNIGNT